MGLPVVTFDFDDVVFPFVKIVAAHLNAKFGTSFVWYKLPTMRFDYIWPLTREEVAIEIREALSTPEAHYLRATPLPGSVETLEWLVKYATVDVVTARDPDRHSEITFDYASHHFANVFRDIHLVGSSLLPGSNWRPKHEVCLAVKSVFHVDDSLYNLRQIHEVGIGSARYGTYGWNRFPVVNGIEQQPPAGMYSADNWQQLKQLLSRQLEIPMF